MHSAPETGARGSSRDTEAIPTAEVLEQVRRVLVSEHFSNSGVLRKLLSFYVQCALDRPEDAPKEYEIATRVMGKGEDFDPRNDSSVRVQTGRLRSKLAEYYFREGANDPIDLEIPRGLYHLVWRYRTRSTADVIQPLIATGSPWHHQVRRWFWPSALVAAACVLLAWKAARPEARATPLESFWSNFAGASEQTLVIFSNPRLVGSPSVGLRFYRPGDPVEDIVDGYTGIGEVAAIQQLTQVFTTMGRSLKVKRAQLLTWDETKGNNLIIVGAPEQNLPQSDMPRLYKFRFKLRDDEPHIGHSAVINQNPGLKEKTLYLASTSRPAGDEYGIMALVPNSNSANRVLILAGTSTLSTQAAAEFACNSQQIAALLGRLRWTSNSHVPFFESLLRVQIRGRVPIHTSIELLYARSGDQLVQR